MTCKHCGKEIPDKSRFCPNCGADQASLNNKDDAVAEKHYDSDFVKSEYYRNMVPFILLIVFTFGIYYLYWVYKTTEYVRDHSPSNNMSPTTQLFLCLLVPIYQLYWIYKVSSDLDMLASEKLPYNTNMALLNLIIALVGGAFVAAIIMQDKINNIVGGATGGNPKSTGVATCKKCGGTFPDSAKSCPHCGEPYKKPFYKQAWFAVLIGAIAIFAALAMVIGIFVVGTATTTTDSYSYDYYVDENGDIINPYVYGYSSGVDDGDMSDYYYYYEDAEDIDDSQNTLIITASNSVKSAGNYKTVYAAGTASDMAYTARLLDTGAASSKKSSWRQIGKILLVGIFVGIIAVIYGVTSQIYDNRKKEEFKAAAEKSGRKQKSE